MDKSYKRFPSSLFAAIALIGFNVQAHTVLSSSAPADDAVETAAPEVIALSFSTEVRLTGLSLKDAAGTAIDLGSIPTATQQAFEIPAPVLQPGAYRVTWRAVGADFHIVSGEFRFEVAELLTGE
ncbi:MAG: copper resistance protein CopC [Rhodospirillaceae bacterium]|nr:copper resistance protein CopC [Rhodospirillaceae bacterium]